MCDDVSEKIVAALMNDGNLPTCKYEDFVAICDNCGDEITTDEDYSIINGEVVCAECAARLNENCDCAECTGEQIAMDIPVPVTAE
jgi:uncharacterized protein YuzB (UPF0349 family)